MLRNIFLFLAIGLFLLAPCVFGLGLTGLAQSSGEIDAVTIVGSWSNAADPSERLELRADGRFSLDEYGQHSDGRWTLNGKTLQLQIKEEFPAGSAQWDGQAFVDSEGKRWVRTAAAKAVTPAPPASQPKKMATADSDGSCPSAAGAYYLDGASWKPMYQIFAAGSSTKVRPIPFASSVKGLALFHNATAPVTVGSGPKFCLSGLQYWRNLVVAAMDVKSDYRQIQIVHVNQYSGVNSGIPENKRQLIDIKPVADGAVEITMKKSLPPGQYMIFPKGIGTFGYDFGVAAAAQ